MIFFFLSSFCKYTFFLFSDHFYIPCDLGRQSKCISFCCFSLINVDLWAVLPWCLLTWHRLLHYVQHLFLKHLFMSYIQSTRFTYVLKREYFTLQKALYNETHFNVCIAFDHVWINNMCFTHIHKLTLAVLSISTSIQVFSLNCVSCSEWHNNEIAQNNTIVWHSFDMRRCHWTNTH